MKTALSRLPAPTTLLATLIEAPDLVRRVRELAPATFSALVKHVGVEDAGEIVALATTEQVVAAFDEDLFVNARPGDRESFDAGRFVIWLEVLLEAGDGVAADRVAELSEDFVVHALSRLVLVLDQEALLARMREDDPAAPYADKAIESSLCEEIDGYLLVARGQDGWDAALAVILALDRDHRELLERLLDRCAALAQPYVEDLDALITAISSEESLAEDVEAEREDRRARAGYVEPRAARSFLELARTPPETDLASRPRDPIALGYFRDLERRASHVAAATPASSPGLRRLLEAAELPEPRRPALPGGSREPILEAMQRLGEEAPGRFAELMEELTFLANVLVAGAKRGERRFRPSEAAEAALATVTLGAELEALVRRGSTSSSSRATAAEHFEVLQACSADSLFRKASSSLASADPAAAGFVRSRAELDRELQEIARGGRCDESARRTARAGRRRRRP